MRDSDISVREVDVDGERHPGSPRRWVDGAADADPAVPVAAVGTVHLELPDVDVREHREVQRLRCDDLDLPGAAGDPDRVRRGLRRFRLSRCARSDRRRVRGMTSRYLRLRIRRQAARRAGFQSCM